MSSDEPPGRRPPRPDGLPLLGNTVEYSRDPFGFFVRCRDLAPVVEVRVGTQRYYQVNEPTAIERVLVHENERYVKGEFFQALLGPLTGNGLLNSEGEFWRRQRHLVQPAFHPDRIAAYADTMVAYTEDLLAEWADGEVVDVHEAMMRLTLRIVADALFGVDVREEAAVVDGALEAVMARSGSVLHSYVPEWLPTPLDRRYDAAVEALDEVVYGIIDRRRAEASGDDEGSAPDDVVSMLLAAEDERGRGMSDEQVRDEVMTLLLAGHETTALSLTFTCYLLGQYPDVEDRLVSELDDAIDGSPTMADLPGLPYTERVVKESMRLYPPVYGFIREPVEDVVLSGYRVPGGSTVTLTPWAVHRDPRWYDDPLAFDPGRWTREFEGSLPRFAYFPFSGGPRRCIGDRFAMLEARLVLATVLRAVHLELVTEPSLDLSASLTTRPTEPVEMRVHTR